MRTIFVVFALFGFILCNITSLHACESCAVVNMGKKEKLRKGQNTFITAKVLYESQDWKELEAASAHNLHHDGHHVHDKQNEEIIHTMLTGHINERLSIDVDIPFVTRHYIEIDSHANLGKNETSKGLGDITLTGDYRFMHDDTGSMGIIAGIKTPTGSTKERNSFGGLMELELQPGTGSFDYIGGLAAAWHPGAIDLASSLIYIYRTEGEQDFRAGDLVSLSLHVDRTFDLTDKTQLRTGVVLNQQLEKKQNSDDGYVKDSGGYTMLLGPQVSLSHGPLSLDLAYLAPVIQNLGGVHQELESGTWTVSVGFTY